MATMRQYVDSINQTSSLLMKQRFIQDVPYTRAILDTTDITRLIRDLQVHERAFFRTESNKSAIDEAAHEAGRSASAADTDESQFNQIIVAAKRLLHVYSVPNMTERFEQIEDKFNELRQQIEQLETEITDKQTQLIQSQSRYDSIISQNVAEEDITALEEDIQRIQLELADRS